MKENLTTEQLRLKFKSQFELVNYSIRLAENMIRSGREPRIKMDIDNPAMQVLAEILAGKDAFEDIPIAIPPAAVAAAAPAPSSKFGWREEKESHKPKPAEKKKPRKILSED